MKDYIGKELNLFGKNIIVSDIRTCLDGMILVYFDNGQIVNAEVVKNQEGNFLL